MFYFALSRHQGTRMFANVQRLRQVSIERREVTTAICQVFLLQKTDEMNNLFLWGKEVFGHL